MSGGDKYHKEISETVIDLTTHFILTFLLACFFRWLTGGWLWPILAFAGGILIDLDHFVDHFLYYGFRFDLKDFFVSRYLTSGKCYIPLHSWEVIALMWLISVRVSWITPVVSGMLLHVLTDYAFRFRSVPSFFSLIYRWNHEFRLDRINSDLYHG